MKHVIFFLVLFCSFALKAQTVVRIQTFDKKYGDPVSQVLVSMEIGDNIEKKYTNKNGETFFTITSPDSVRFSFEHVSFQAINPVPIRKYSTTKKDTITHFVRMYIVKERELDVVKVYPVGRPDTVFGSKRLSVSDFEFLANGNMLLLTYPKNIKKGTELLIYDGFQVRGEVPIEGKGTELIRDYRGNPHVVTENTVYGLYLEGERIQLGQVDKGYYFKYIAPIVDTTHTKYFFSNYNPDIPTFDYFTYDLIDSSYQKIAKITDDLMLELYRSEYKWVDVRTKLWAREKERETGIDKEIWVGASYFTQSIYYKELYAPLFRKNDTIILFDHYKNWLFRFSNTGELIDSIAIYHHIQPKETGWKENILQDQLTGEIYMYYEKDGKSSLRLFDINTGKVGAQIPLSFKYVDKVLIRQNFVYYTYRPFESMSKKFLYRERLPFDFLIQNVNNDKIISKEK